MRSLSLKPVSTCLAASLTLIGCSQPSNFAPVKSANQALTPKNGYMPSPPPHPSVYSQPEEQINNAPVSASAENKRSLPGSPAREETINNSDSPSQTTTLKPQATPARQQSAISESGKPARAMQPYFTEPDATKTGNNQSASPKNYPPLALKKLENSVKSSLSAKQLEKNSYKEKSILSIDNKKVLKLKFEWPLNGRITRNFVQTDNKGIDISGKMGQSVHAAEAGKAVYCGHGLKGFGNLAVIKHNETYLSAYANASRLFIKEGQRISKGQAIGEIGDSGFKRALLHFEIRKNGKSINPLTVLPKL